MADVDIAKLGIEVKTSGAKEATKDLTNLANTAEKTEKATKGAASGSAALTAAINTLIGATNANTSAMGVLTGKMESYRGSTTGAAAATDDMESRVSRLRASVDPMAAAIDRVNAELQEARILFEAGAMSAEDYARAQVVLNARSADFARRQGMMNDAMGMGARSAKLQAHEVLNLSRQFADIGVTAAMGMNPLMILVQQGPQIADVLSTARARGISAGQAFAQMGAGIRPFVGALTGVGVAAGVAFAAMGLGLREMNKGIGDVQKEFGLTEKQMERLKDKGVELGYTWGDMFSGIGYAIKGVITEAFGEELDQADKLWNEFLDNEAKGAVRAVKDIVGTFVGGYYMLTAVWEMLPAAMADISIQAVNYVIQAVEDMVNKSAGAINSLIEAVPAWARPSGRVGTISLDKVKNENEGAAKKTLDKAVAAYKEGFGVGEAAVDRTLELIGEGMGKSRAERIKEGAGKADAAKKAKASDEEKAWDKAVEGADDYIKSLKEATEEIGKNIFEIKRMETAREAAELVAAAAATGRKDAMETAIKKTKEMTSATDAWIEATNKEKIKDFTDALKKESDQLAFEATLIGKSHEERERMIKMREINIKIMELEKEGYYGVAAAARAEAETLANAAGAKGALEDKVEAATRATEEMKRMNDSVREVTASFGELFGSVGEGFANMLDVIMDYNEKQAEATQRQAELDRELAEGKKTATQYEFEKGQIEKEMADARINQYGQMISAAKTFFKEGSTGWKIMETAERAYRLFQFAMQIKAMFMDKAETVSSVANSGARAAADGVAAVAKAIASLPFPLNIAAGAATLAFLIAIGVKMFGGGGGKATSSASSSAEKTLDVYRGPRDEFGAPTSYYSVLKPGQTTVAGGMGASDFGAYGRSGVTVNGGGITVNVQGNMVQDTVTELVPVLEQYRDMAVQDARAAVSNDIQIQQGRQSIGG